MGKPWQGQQILGLFVKKLIEVLEKNCIDSCFRSDFNVF